MSVAAEQNLIGGILIEPEAFYRVTDLQARHFRDIENRKAFATIQRLLAEGKGVDRELVAEAGGGDPSYLGSLMNNTPGTANIVYYAESIKRDARRLHVELSLKNALSRLAEDSTGVEEVVQATMTALEDYQEHHSKPFSQIVGETLAQAEEAREQRRNSQYWAADLGRTKPPLPSRSRLGMGHAACRWALSRWRWATMNSQQER
jgi:replicative DNA helicase